MTAPWDCQSCGAVSQQKSFCETCGAAMPVESGGEDSALSLMLGLVCERCDAYNDPGVLSCVACGAPLPSVEGSGKFPALADQVAPIVAAIEAAPAPAEATPVSAGPPVPASAPAAAPQQMPWMAAPTGQPLATRFTVPKVDLATISTPAHGVPGLHPPNLPTSTPPISTPPISTPPISTPPSAAPPSAAPQSGPAASASDAAGAPTSGATRAACAKCGTPPTANDRFCRTCGARIDVTAPLSTTQIAAFKLPSPVLPSPILGGTSVMPSFGGARLEAGAPSATMVFGAATAERTAKLVLVRGQSQFGTQWRLQSAETVVGRTDGVVLFPDDPTLAPRHCRLVWRDAELWLHPEPTTNGVYLRLRGPSHVGPGDELVVGAQRLRVLADGDRPLHMTSPDPTTKVLGSLVRPGAAISLMRIAPTAAENEVFHRHQRLLTLGRNRCDVNFPRDGFVSERHAQLTRTDEGPLLLEDLRSRNGTYLRVHKPEKLVHGDLVMLGDKVLRVELPR